MPELPEVEVVVNSLKKVVLNKQIKNIFIFKPKMIKDCSPIEFAKQLRNQTIVDVSRHSKFIVFHFSDCILLSHLRMEGKYFYYHQKVAISKHHHLVFTFKDGSELHYQDTRLFGTFNLRTKENYQKILPLSKIAKEPKDIDVKALYQKLQKKRIAIKTALLDQTLIAGLGNIYADETLFAAKISPIKKSNEITLIELKNILHHADKVFKASIAMGGTTISSFSAVYIDHGHAIDGRFQSKLNVHLQKGKKCVTCQKIIIKIKVNGRGTYYCANCQK